MYPLALRYEMLSTAIVTDTFGINPKVLSKFVANDILNLICYFSEKKKFKLSSAVVVISNLTLVLLNKLKCPSHF